MIAPTKRMVIAAIGDEDLVGGLRLAGLKRCRVVHDERQPEREVRDALREMLADEEVGIIVMLEEHAAAVADLLAPAREGRRLAPVILPIPSKRGTAYADARSYYKDYIRKFIGFDIEV